MTVNVPDTATDHAALAIVITNATGAAVDISSIRFTVSYGAAGNVLMQSLDGVHHAVSDTVNWSFSADQPEDGSVDFTLAPTTGTSVALEAGASLVASVIDFATATAAGTTMIAVAERSAGAPPAFADLAVTTFPAGFYLDGLTATVSENSALVPAVQVDPGTGVTLLWNSSVTDTDDITVLYADGVNGQRAGSVTIAGRCVVPALTSDTVFVVLVDVKVGGLTLRAAATAAVAVPGGPLSATGITTGALIATARLSGAGAVTMLAAGQDVLDVLTGGLPVTAPTDGFVIGTATYGTQPGHVVVTSTNSYALAASAPWAGCVQSFTLPMPAAALMLLANPPTESTVAWSPAGFAGTPGGET